MMGVRVPILPCLSGQPLSAVSRVDALGMVLSAPPEKSDPTRMKEKGPQPLEVKVTAMERLWPILDEDEVFREKVFGWNASSVI